MRLFHGRRKMLKFIYIKLAFVVSLLVSPAFAAEEYLARISGHWSPTHQSAIHSQLFADEVTKRSNGRLKVEFYPSKQLFDIRTVMGGVTSGAVEMGGIVGVVSFPKIQCCFVPWAVWVLR
jgi:TRAP-type C4-dicarboxylate transport system substrate-binding protein